MKASAFEMSPLQGSQSSLQLRRALPYANECRPFRAETTSVSICVNLWLNISIMPPEAVR